MSDLTKTLVIIPARAGSKRIVGKNSKELKGKPLVAYSIEYAQKYIHADIIISTDDPLIAEITKSYGVNCLNRTEDLAKDTSPTIDVLKDVLNRQNKTYENVVLLQPTNPLRPDNLFGKAWIEYQKSPQDGLLTVSKNDKKLGAISNGKYTPTSYKFGQRSQDLEDLYYENGLLYILPTSLISQGVLMGKNPTALNVDHPFGSVDIDTELDWLWAELILEKYR
jgi:CMP-N-acetylneuraminic acid synthetase